MRTRTEKELRGAKQQIRHLEAWFERRGLSLENICRPVSPDPCHRARQMQTMQRFVKAYEETPSRDALQKRGFPYPPVEPGFDPDSDWELFERWIGHEPTEWTYTEVFGAPPPSEQLDDKQLGLELDRMLYNLESSHVAVSFEDEAPQRAVYSYLLELLEEPIQFTADGVWTVIDGCSGYCPECFIKEWCDANSYDSDDEPSASVMC